MNASHTHTPREIATAWGLWNSLHEHAQALWDRYEAPFIDIIREEQRLEMMGPPPPSPPLETDEVIEDDIPF